MNVNLALLPLKKSLNSAKSLFRWCLKCTARGVRIAHGVALSNTKLNDYANIAHHAELSDAVVGKRTSVGRYTKVRNADIGSYCSVSWDVTIGAVRHPMDHPSTHAFSYRSQFGIVDANRDLSHERVKIGNDVWVGCGSIIMPGVRVGDGAVIGAGAVVTKDVAPYSVVSGVPARHMKLRFEPEMITRLEALRWWDWDDEKLKEHIEFFQQPLDESTFSKLLEKGEQ